MVREDEIKPKQMAIYSEDDGQDLVEVLKNLSNRETISYKLKIVRNLRPYSPPGVTHLPGYEFECDKLRGVSCGGLWSLASLDTKGRNLEALRN